MVVLVPLQVLVDLVDQQGHGLEGSPAQVHYTPRGTGQREAERDREKESENHK